MTLEDRLKQMMQAADKHLASVDWENSKVRWKKSVGEFYSKIEEWLNVYINKGYPIKFEKEDIDIEEFKFALDDIDKYQIARLLLIIGDSTIYFEPIGLNILGAEGRIDFFPLGNKRNSVTILLRTAENGDDWKIWAPDLNSPYQLLHDQSISQTIFEEILEKWL